MAELDLVTRRSDAYRGNGSKSPLARTREHIQSGIVVEIRPADRTSESLEKAFPSEPKEHFIMSVDDEAFWVSRFNTIGQAKDADLAFDDGFRFSNWHFAGLITVETSNRIVNALNAKPED